MTEMLTVQTSVIGSHTMNLFRLYSWHLATAGMLLGAFSFSNQFQGGEEDLLDPSLDRPLPQYESTRQIRA